MTGWSMPATYSRSSSPCSCTAPRPTSAATPLTYSAGWFTNTPTGTTNGGSVDTIARARSGSMKRGLLGQNTNPSAVGAGLDGRLRVLEDA